MALLLTIKDSLAAKPKNRNHLINFEKTLDLTQSFNVCVQCNLRATNLLTFFLFGSLSFLTISSKISSDIKSAVKLSCKEKNT